MKQLAATPIEVPNTVLRQMLAAGEFRDGEGASHSLHSHLGVEHANALYRTVLQQGATNALEIGMAFGVSTLAMLTALDQTGTSARLISVDPNQTADWRQLGRYNVSRAGLSHRHELREQPDYLALPEMVSQGIVIDVAYVDGWHTFDYVLLDFFYIDKLLPVGGVIGFNDCGFRSVGHVLRFVRSHRKYEEINVGLQPDYAGRNHLYSAARRVLRQSRSDRYFRKVAAWEPSWDFYARF